MSTFTTPQTFSPALVPGGRSQEAASQANSFQTTSIDEALIIELIDNSDIVSRETLEEVLVLSKLNGKSSLNVLFESGFIAAADYKAFIGCHNIVLTGVLHKPWAIACLQRSINEFVPFESMLESMELHPLTAFSDSKLGRLAIATQLVTAMEFEQARRFSLKNGFTIGQSFVNLGFLCSTSYKLLLQCFSLQCLGQDVSVLRDLVKSAGFDFMRRGINGSKQHNVSLTNSLSAYEKALGENGLNKGLELILSAGVMDEFSVLSMIEDSLEQNLAFRTVFAESFGSNYILESAVKLANLVESGEFAREMAVRMLQDAFLQFNPQSA